MKYIGIETRLGEGGAVYTQYIFKDEDGRLRGIDKEVADLNGVHDIGPKSGMFYTSVLNEKKLLEFARREFA
jgi:hypothetical protein